MTAGEQRLPHRGVAEDARQAQLTRCLRHLNMLAPLFKKKQGSLVRNRFGRNTWRQESLCIYFINSNPSFPECWVNEPPSSLTLNPS